MTEPYQRFTPREVGIIYEIVKDLANLPQDENFLLRVADIQKRAELAVMERHKRRSIANQTGGKISAALRKEKTEQRNTAMREAILKLLAEGVTTPMKISRELIAQGFVPPKALRWSNGQLRSIAPEIPKRELPFT